MNSGPSIPSQGPGSGSNMMMGGSGNSQTSGFSGSGLPSSHSSVPGLSHSVGSNTKPSTGAFSDMSGRMAYHTGLSHSRPITQSRFPMNPNAPNFPGPGMGGKFSSGSSGNMSGNPASTTSSVPASSNTPAFSSAQPPAPAASTQANQVTGEIILSASYQQHSPLHALEISNSFALSLILS